ncbi:hypothetical protein D3C84_735970 [compost metagenome]
MDAEKQFGRALPSLIVRERRRFFRPDTIHRAYGHGDRVHYPGAPPRRNSLASRANRDEKPGLMFSYTCHQSLDGRSLGVRREWK